jgi:hypothetical protein
MNPDSHDLIQRHMAGLLTEDEAAVLQTRLKADTELRRLYLHYMNLDVALEAQAGSRDRVIDLVRAAPLPEKKTSGRWLSWLPLTAAAAVVAFAGMALLWVLKAQQPWIAEMVEAQEAHWEGSTLPTETGSSLSAGRLRLVEGLARLRFSSGAEVTLEGPVEMELINPLLCRLHRGSMVAHVPETAHGFSVLTPTATLIDHGTDFGISSDSIGNARVHVMQGEVELRHSSGAAPVRLATREMADITPERVLPVAPMEAEPRQLSVELSPPSFAAEITTRSGRGTSAFVSEVPGEGGDQSPILLLKNSLTQTGFGRKVLLRFDLGAFPDAQAITEAQLTFNMVPTGSGYASRANEARIVAYALTEHTETSWQPKALKWPTQPAFHANAGKVDESLAVRVGEVVVPRGVQSGAFSIRSVRLSEAMKSAGHRPLTIILVRENPVEQETGLVLGIAGNRHPVLQPPTLSVR